MFTSLTVVWLGFSNGWRFCFAKEFCIGIVLFSLGCVVVSVREGERVDGFVLRRC